MGRIIENNLLDNSVEEEFPGFQRGFRPSLSGQCGQPGPAQQIVGGEEATAHSFPWMAALFVDGKVSPKLPPTPSTSAAGASYPRSGC